MNILKLSITAAVSILCSLCLHAQSDTLSNPKDTASTYWVDAESGDTVYSKADTMPSFPGGELEFQQFLVQNVRYPMMEKEQGKMGTVYVSFRVETDGRITHVQCKRGVEGAPGLCREAVRVIGLMPNWNPGTVNGKNVTVEMVMPMKFTLVDTKKKKKR